MNRVFLCFGKSNSSEQQSVLCVVQHNLCFFKIFLSTPRPFPSVYSVHFTTMSSNTSSANTKEQPETCTLVIDNFSSCTTNKESHTFLLSDQLPTDRNTSFILCMNPNIDLTNTSYWDSKNVSFTIYLGSSPNNGKIAVRYRMSIVNAQGQKCNTQEGIINYIKKYQFGGQYILNRDVLLDTAKGWLVNDKLTVYCEVYPIESDLDDSTPLKEPMKPSTILQDYGSLFESGKLSDVVLVAGGTEFKVHKNILCARSAVFGAMFEHDTKEKQDNRIEVKDVSAETYQDLLRYIYTDKVDNLEENALELMEAADKYQLDHLKSICEQYLCANLTTESVAITLVMADLHRAEPLKLKCFEYICDNARAVESTEGWKTLLTKPELLSKVFFHLYDKHNK